MSLCLRQLPPVMHIVRINLCKGFTPYGGMRPKLYAALLACLSMVCPSVCTTGSYGAATNDLIFI
jgi:hypothetical protein